MIVARLHGGPLPVLVAVGPSTAVFRFHLGRTGTVGTGDIRFLFRFGFHFVLFLSGRRTFSSEDDAFSNNLLYIHNRQKYNKLTSSASANSSSSPTM